MKFNRRNGVLALSLLFLSIFWNACATRTKTTVQIPHPEEAESEGNPNARDRWFLFQRMYPFDSIPTDARRKAWEALKREKRLHPQADTSLWTSVGPGPTIPPFAPNGLISGRINSIAVSPQDQRIVLIGSASGGIWRSTDAGGSFAPVSDSQADLAVGSIQFSASNPSIAYAGMGDAYGGILGTGVLKSTDSGASWTRVDSGSLPQPGTVTRILVDPTNPNQVYLLQYSMLNSGVPYSSGFFYSTDGGVTWTKTATGLGTDMAISPIDPHTLYLAMARVDNGPLTGPAGVYRSTDSGQNWALLYKTPYDNQRANAIEISESPFDGRTIYVYSGGSISNQFQIQLQASTDAGATWNPRSTAGLDSAQFGYNSYIFQDPTNAATVYIGSRDVFKSTDGGSTWNNLTRTFTQRGGAFEFTPDSGISHSDQHSFAFVPGSAPSFYIGNDGGLWSTTDGGATFESHNSSLQLTQFYGLSVSPADSSRFFGGAQDNGLQCRSTSNSTWVQVLTGDGGHSLYDPMDPNTVYATVQYGSIFKFGGGGTGFEATLSSNSTFGESGNPRIAFIAPLANSGVDSTLYFGTWRLYKSSDQGSSWNLTSNKDLTKGNTASGPDVLNAIAIARSDPNTIYAGSAQGRLMVTKNGGTKWNDISAGIPNRSIKSITIDPQSAATAYVTVSGYETGHVFATTNYGATWNDISGTLPDLPTNALLLDPSNSNVLYIGNDIGVYRSSDGGKTWQAFNDGMPPVIVNSLAVNSTMILAGSYGRGAYQATLPPAPAPDFSIAANPPSLTADRGAVASVEVDVTRQGGFSGPVTITIPSAANLSIKVKPASATVTGASAVVKLKVKANAPVGSQTLAIVAVDQSGRTRTANLSLTIQ